MYDLFAGNKLPFIVKEVSWHNFCEVDCEASQLGAGCQEPGKLLVLSVDVKE
jgi:hypothetical protein